MAKIYGEPGSKLLVVAILAALIVCGQSSYRSILQDYELRKKPNILFMVADDLKPIVGHLNVTGIAPETPNIDALANQGVYFTNAHCCAPMCNPSRTCFLYGLPTTKTKVENNKDDAANPTIKDLEHLIAYFKRQGYYTVNGQRIFHSGTSVDQQYDEKYWQQSEGAYNLPEGQQLADPRVNPKLDFGIIDAPLEEHYDYVATTRMLESMGKNKDKLGMYSLGFRSCHVPHYIPKEIADTIEQPPIYPPIPDDDFDDIPFEGTKVGAFTQDDAEVCINNKEIGDVYLTAYYGCVKMVDIMVGRLMEFVNNSPEPWFVVFTSDHGYHTMDKRRLSKYTGWTQSTQVPLVLYGGKSVGGAKIDMPVSLIDLYKTFIDVVNGDEPLTHEPEGISLYGLTENSGERDAVVVTFDQGDKAVVTKKWQFISYKGREGREYELYDKNVDPWNLNNVVEFNEDVQVALDAIDP